MDFGRRRRSGAGNNGSNEFPNLTQFDEVRTTPIAANNTDGQSSMFGDTFGGAYAAPSGDQPAYGYRPAGEQPSFGGAYDRPVNNQPSFGNGAYDPAGQSGYFVAPIPQNTERPMVFSDSRVKGQYIYEYSDRLEYYQVSGNRIVHCATKYKIKN